VPPQPDLSQLMKQAQLMQQQLAAAQEDLAAQSVEGSAGGGLVRATMTGSGELTALTIDPAAVDPDDVEMLSDMVLAATNEALRKAQDLAADRLGAATGGLMGPGGLGGLGIPGF